MVVTLLYSISVLLIVRYPNASASAFRRTCIHKNHLYPMHLSYFFHTFITEQNTFIFHLTKDVIKLLITATLTK